MTMLSTATAQAIAGNLRVRPPARRAATVTGSAEATMATVQPKAVFADSWISGFEQSMYSVYTNPKSAIPTPPATITDADQMKNCLMDEKPVSRCTTPASQLGRVLAPRPGHDSGQW